MHGEKWIKVGGHKVRLYSSLEAANYCGGPDNSVSIQTINLWRTQGWFSDFLEIGRGYYYRKEWLDQCLEDRGLQNRIHED